MTVPADRQPYGQGAVPSYGGAMIGKVRSTGVAILLAVVTLGSCTWHWYYSVDEEMKRHKGCGLGGGIALLLTGSRRSLGATD